MVNVQNLIISVIITCSLVGCSSSVETQYAPQLLSVRQIGTESFEVYKRSDKSCFEIRRTVAGFKRVESEGASLDFPIINSLKNDITCPDIAASAASQEN